MRLTFSLLRVGLLVLATLLVLPTARAEGPSPELKISYSLATLSESQGQQATQGDLWDRIRAGFKLPESDPRLTRVHEQWFAAHPAYLERGIQRSRLYLFHIVEEVEKRGKIGRASCRERVS
jgi:membrane-bound lytic murein transglycosylase D